MNITRRTFLAAAGAGALALGPTASVASAVKRTVPHGRAIRVGVIGLGDKGLPHLWYFSELAATHGYDVSIPAIADAWKARREFARGWRNQSFDVLSSGQDIIARDDIDAVVIATPSHTQAPLAIAAMESGKHVLAHAPMALSLGEAGVVHEVAKRSGCAYQMALPRAITADHLKAIRSLENRAIGSLKYVQMRLPLHVNSETMGCPPTGVPAEHDVNWDAFTMGERVPFAPERFTDWRMFKQFAGGIPLDRFYDALAPIICATKPGTVKSAAAAGGVTDASRQKIPDNLVINLEFSHGVRIVIATSSNKTGHITGTFRGEKGRIAMNSSTSATLYPDEGRARELDVSAHDQSAGTSIWRNWFDAIRGDAPCCYNEDLAYEAMVPIALAMQAYEERRTIRV